MHVDERVFAIGDALSGLGVLVTAEHGVVRGVSLRAEGSGLSLVHLSHVMARPWSGRLVPWEESAWSAPLITHEESVSLDAVVVPAQSLCASVSMHERLLCAVWLSVKGTAHTEGTGELTLSVSDAKGAWVAKRHVVRVQREREHTVLRHGTALRERFVLAMWTRWLRRWRERFAPERPLLLQNAERVWIAPPRPQAWRLPRRVGLVTEPITLLVPGPGPSVRLELEPCGKNTVIPTIAWAFAAQELGPDARTASMAALKVLGSRAWRSRAERLTLFDGTTTHPLRSRLA